MKLQAKEGYKITDKNRSFFNDFIYVPDNYNPNDYEEVGYDIWGLFVNNEIPSNNVEELSNKINILKKENQKLEDNIYILEGENTKQNEVIQNMMMDILDLMYPDDSK